MSDTEIVSLAKAFVSTTIERNRDKKTCGREYLSKLVFPDLQSYHNFLSTTLHYLNISLVILVSYLSLSTSLCRRSVLRHFLALPVTQPRPFGPTRLPHVRSGSHFHLCPLQRPKKKSSLTTNTSSPRSRQNVLLLPPYLYLQPLHICSGTSVLFRCADSEAM